MDVLTDSSLTLIVKTSEPENANVEESTGESPSFFPQSLSVCHILSTFFFVCKKKNVAAVNRYQPTFPATRQKPSVIYYKILKT